MLLLRWIAPNANRWLGALVFAFLIAIVGDYFLGIRTTDIGFVLGIGGYLLTHIGFWTYAWHNITGRRRFTWWVFALILLPFIVLYVTMFWPTLQSHIPLAIAVFVYLAMSCLTLASSIDISRRQFSWRWVFAAGVLCLLLSDATIGLHNFADRHELYRLYMWPLFYTAMILVALSVVLQHFLKENTTEGHPVNGSITSLPNEYSLEEDGGEFTYVAEP